MNLFRRGLLGLCLLAIVFESSGFAQSSSVSTSQTTQTPSTFFSKERWGASYSNYMNGATFSESTGASINHYFSLKHKLKSGWALSGVFRPDSNYGNEKAASTLGDSYARVDTPTLYDSGNGTTVKSQLRYYAPLSESSQKAKLNGTIVPYFELGSKIDRVDLSYILIPKVYLYSDQEEGQKLAAHGHWLAAAYKVSSLLNVDFALYPIWTYNRGGTVAFNNLPAYPGVTFNFSEEFSVSPYVEIPLTKLETKTMSAGGTLSYKFL